MQQQHYDKKVKGYVTITSVLILGAIGLLVVTSGLSVSTENIISVSSIEKSKQARALAASCAEITIDKLKVTSAYTGNETLNLPFGTCSVGTISGTGNSNRSFQVSSSYLNYTKKINIVIAQINPNTNITTWQEVE